MVPLFLHVRFVRALLLVISLVGSLWQPKEPGQPPPGDVGAAAMSLVPEPPPAPPTAPLFSEAEPTSTAELLPIVDERIVFPDEEIPRGWWQGPVRLATQRHAERPATASAPARLPGLPPRHLARLGQRFQLLDERGTVCTVRVSALEVRARFWFGSPEEEVAGQGGAAGLARAMLRGDKARPELVARFEAESGRCARARWAVPLGAPVPTVHAVREASAELARAAYQAYRATAEWKWLQAEEQRVYRGARDWDDGKPLAAFEITSATRRLVYLRFFIPCAPLHVLLEADDPGASPERTAWRLRSYRVAGPGAEWRPAGITSFSDDDDEDPEGVLEGAAPGTLMLFFPRALHAVPLEGKLEAQSWRAPDDECHC